MSTEAIHAQLRCGLQRLGADRHPHSGRSLLDHLVGTAELLSRWGCAAHVCAAGMYHSIYGTNAFSIACQGREQREVVVSLIGERAERLVHLFAISERPIAFFKAVGSGYLSSRFDGSQHPVTLDELRELIAIECANLIEQRGQPGLVEVLLALPEAQRSALVDANVIDGIERSNGEGNA
ncbi:DUF6817 domain-containing protein [Stenotrophomonas maltophilia]|uniref:DUF6817 domain-containing protein n=1 Tax=Stenotrophomonas maltophilia TaxID=40324 RepID=UPI000D0AE48E|nr:hypothetical protein [Stenotrophomonas maltophilia]AVO32152.1 hypothetical protein C6Y55_20550 [Stenotrophomonas maltophilia]MCU1126500.1 hypothetical protein [Stenotrophomonas maltophilia]